MSMNEEGFMRVSRLLLIPLLISACTLPIEAQSSPDTEPSQLLSTLPQESAQAGISIDHLQLPPPLESHVVHFPPFGQRGVCYCIRGYRVTRDDPESDSTRPAGYSTCQPAARFHVKDADDLRETVIR
jgi:hypothetical protein